MISRVLAKNNTEEFDLRRRLKVLKCCNVRVSYVGRRNHARKKIIVPNKEITDELLLRLASRHFLKILHLIVLLIVILFELNGSQFRRHFHFKFQKVVSLFSSLLFFPPPQKLSSRKDAKSLRFVSRSLLIETSKGRRGSLDGWLVGWLAGSSASVKSEKCDKKKKKRENKSKLTNVGLRK